MTLQSYMNIHIKKHCQYSSYTSLHNINIIELNICPTMLIAHSYNNLYYRITQAPRQRKSMFIFNRQESDQIAVWTNHFIAQKGCKYLVFIFSFLALFSMSKAKNIATFTYCITCSAPHFHLENC